MQRVLRLLVAVSADGTVFRGELRQGFRVGKVTACGWILTP